MARARRQRPDPLLPVNALRWLVVRNHLSQAIECEQLQPMTDLRATLEQERDERRLDGWTVEEIPKSGAFFFCALDDERCCIAIESYAPDTAPLR
jgi:hypothetical protein